MLEKGHKAAVIREQLSVTTEPLKALKKPNRPGWIRSIREALGMSGKQLAFRIQVEPPRITEMEKAEATGNITLRSLRRAAEAMDCDLVYALVPKTNLNQTLQTQALQTVQKRMDRVSHTMLLEGQFIGKGKEQKMLEEKAQELVRDLPRWLWDSK